MHGIQEELIDEVNRGSPRKSGVLRRLRGLLGIIDLLGSDLLADCFYFILQSVEFADDLLDDLVELGQIPDLVIMVRFTRYMKGQVQASLGS